MKSIKKQLLAMAAIAGILGAFSAFASGSQDDGGPEIYKHIPGWDRCDSRSSDGC